MSNQSNKRDSGGQGVHGSQTGQPGDQGNADSQRDGLDIPSGHEADSGDGEEEAVNNSPNTGDLRPGGN